MEKLVINGGKKIYGDVEISGAKNAAVAILPSSVLASKGVSVIENVPDIEDVHCSLKILESLGCKVSKNKNTVTIDSTNITTVYANTEDVRKMRASYYILGALLSRFKEASADLPGGCPIGVRPIDQHIKGFEALGASVEITGGTVKVKADKLVGTNIFFDVVSVGATMNVMMAATLAEGVTIMENVAKEPHVVDLANYLNSMGANIKGAGTDIIRVTGVKELKGCNYSVIPDQIEAGTYMIAAAACGGEVRVKNVIPKHLDAITAKLVEMGVEVLEEDDAVVVKSNCGLKAVNVKTLPYPGFPTDIQQPMSSLLCIANGKSIVNESIWESRFKHVAELNKMGAKIDVNGRTAVIEGIPSLKGAKVVATDLRAGAAMVVAGLIADDVTEITGIEHIDRGYPHIEDKFISLGADIRRENI